MEGGHKGPVPLPQLKDAQSLQQLSDWEEIELRPDLTIKYEFIRRSDLAESRFAQNASGGPERSGGGDRTTIGARLAQSQQAEPKLLPSDGYMVAMPGFSKANL
jgi:hypothetical protein